MSRDTPISSRARWAWLSVRSARCHETPVSHDLTKIRSYLLIRIIWVIFGNTRACRNSWLFFLGWILFKVCLVHSERSMLYSDPHRALWTWLLMMSMSFMSDTLNSSDPSKSAFLEFGHGLPTNQQHLAGFPHNIYSVHGLHSSGHDGPYPPAASHYSRPLGYAYPAPVNAPAPSPYMPYPQNSNIIGTLGHNTRAEETSKCPKKETSKCFLRRVPLSFLYCGLHATVFTRLLGHLHLCLMCIF